ncbi:hypothetical protein TNCV_3380971 [Trichonephila clavipes]|nr:hypothetical protein TNCV_3380971 [Trichonephila clavipes]
MKRETQSCLFLNVTHHDKGLPGDNVPSRSRLLVAGPVEPPSPRAQRVQTEAQRENGWSGSSPELIQKFCKKEAQSSRVFVDLL